MGVPPARKASTVPISDRKTRRTPVVVDAPLGDVPSLLDEKHMVLWARDLHKRERAADLVVAALRSVQDAQVVSLPGAVIHDLKSLRSHLDAALPSAEHRPLRATIDGPAGLLARLREPADPLPDHHHIKWRYYVWRDADVLLRSSPAAFSIMVDAVAGVAAEAEFTSDDLLLIQRLVLVGGPALQVAAQDPYGPMNAWRPGSPWARLTKVMAPVFECREIPATV
jgi:hypothetical protein